MSDTTSKLQLPILAADQAQKHVTHNEALLHLDALVQAAVLDRDLSVPPPAPAAGDAYIVAAAASGDWSGREGQLAVWRDNAWYFHQPREGWRVWVRDEDVLLVFDGGVWALATTSLNPADGGMVGINTTATTMSRLSAKSAEVTLDHDGASMQLKLNKAAATDKAHLVFYDGWSGRAEIGLVGNDDLTVKVSADGSTWNDVLVIDDATGNIDVKQALTRAGNTVWDDGSAARSLASDGYQKLPSGLIIQWGRLWETDWSYSTVTFPIAFPTACVSAVATSSWTSGGGFNVAVIGNLSTTSFELTHSSNTSAYINWIAVGY